MSATKTARLEKDIIRSRYGRPLRAALTLCLELEEEILNYRDLLNAAKKLRKYMDRGEVNASANAWFIEAVDKISPQSAPAIAETEAQ